MSTTSEDVDTYSSTSSSSSEGREVYTSFFVAGIKRWKHHPLPESRNIDGRQVWEPPIFAYNELIGDEYEKKREAVLKYTKDDRAKATEILNIDTEGDLLEIYSEWLMENVSHAHVAGDTEKGSFFADRYNEIDEDENELNAAYGKLGIKQKRSKNGNWEFKGNWENFSEEFEGLHSSSSENDSNDSEKDARQDKVESATNNPRICTAANDEEELTWLSSIDPEAYPPLGSDGEADDEESNDSSDSDAYLDARSTSSREEEETDLAVS